MTRGSDALAHMDLIREGLNVVIRRQSLLERLDCIGIFALRRQHTEWNLDFLGVFGIDHCWVDFADCGKRSIGLGSQRDHLYSTRQSTVHVDERGPQERSGQERIRQTFPPQHIPIAPQFLIVPLLFSCISLTTFNILGTFFGGAALVEKNWPSFSPFSFVSGGYQEWSAGSPSKKSGTKTWYWCCLSSACEMMSAPCIRQERICSAHIGMAEGESEDVPGVFEG